MTRFYIQSLLARFPIHCEQLIDPGHDRASHRISRIQLDHIGKTATGMRPTPRVYHARTSDSVVSCVGIGLQKAMEILQKLFGSGTISSQAKVEHRRSSRSSVLPQIWAGSLHEPEYDGVAWSRMRVPNTRTGPAS